jgi:cyclophilin family peptidyl-prolyl cis-trans isomerase
MNQTTAIVSGGVFIVAVAMLFYFMSGDGLPKPISNIAVEDKTLTLPPPLTTTETDAIKNTMPETQQAGATTALPSEVTLKTTKGTITLRLASADAPKTVANFAKLAQSGFYDGVKFHRVIKGFMIQGGDPLSKDDTQPERWGTGGPGYKFADEINAQSALYQKGYKRGVVAMANSGPNTNGSQFFIMHQDYPLPPLYAIFGEVVSGQDVVDAIATTPTGANDRPITPMVIESVTVK